MTSIKRVTVVGGGLMGSGIAQRSATYNYDVVIVELTEELVKNTQQNIEHGLLVEARRRFKSDPDAQSKYVHNAKEHLSYTLDLKDAVKNADLVIEAIVEKLDIKQNLFVTIEKFAPSHTIMVTNTSSLLVADISKLVKRRTHFAGLHFFSPILSKVVEIIRGSDTSDATFKSLQGYATGIEMANISCKDVHGFTGNGLLIPFLSSAVKMVENGIAEPEDIDKVFKLGIGHPVGPIELADVIGLDVCNNINIVMHAAEPSNPIYAPGLFAKKVAEGKLGRKSGEGFYKYPQTPNKSKL